jgi:hypothetical protein
MSKFAIEKTDAWLRDWVIALNLCPFAGHPYEQGKVDIVATESGDVDSVFRFVLSELDRLQQTAPEELETTLVVVEKLLASFDEYLDFLQLLESAISESGLEGIVQIASFHPHYCFEGVAEDDAANYTNRSPFPMFHLIREESLEKAVAAYPEPEKIPQRNIKLLREMGIGEILSRYRKMA